jgi:hypothetical protein
MEPHIYVELPDGRLIEADYEDETDSYVASVCGESLDQMRRLERDGQIELLYIEDSYPYITYTFAVNFILSA